jgi:hypothetical protein
MLTMCQQLLSEPATEFHGRRFLAVRVGGGVPVRLAGPDHQAHRQMQVLPEEDQREGKVAHQTLAAKRTKSFSWADAV